MNEIADFENKISEHSLEILKELEAGDELTSWQLKTKLHLSASLLYLSLGYLLEQGKISIVPDGLNYKIKQTSKNGSQILS